MRRVRTTANVLLGLCALLFLGTPQSRAGEQITVFAAASLKETAEAVAEKWEAETGNAVTLSFAGSSALARQIEAGAPADLFLSADQRWMDYLSEKGLVAPQSRVDLLRNRLVLVAPKADAKPVDIAPGFPLATLLGESRLAMANVDAVPAGTYGKAALESLGVWDGVKDRVAQAENVRAALLLVSRGEAPYGVVYETDAKVDPSVAIVGRFPEESHPAIIYPAARLLTSKTPASASFLTYLQGPEAHAIFTAAGFSVMAKTE